MRTVGYFEGWNSGTRPCNVWQPENIDSRSWTHLNLAFATIDPVTYHISQMASNDSSLFLRFSSLKDRNSQLQVFISVGGWNAGNAIFSAMTATPERRASFIQSAIQFMTTFGYDGIDIDWEHPMAADRGGSSSDADNYLTLLKELRTAMGSAFGISVAIPASYSKK